MSDFIEYFGFIIFVSLASIGLVSIAAYSTSSEREKPINHGHIISKSHVPEKWTITIQNGTKTRICEYPYEVWIHLNKNQIVECEK